VCAAAAAASPCSPSGPVGGQPGAQPPVRQPRGVLDGRKAGEEGQADRRVEIGEQPDGAREHDPQVGAQLVADRHSRLDEVGAGAHDRAQGQRRGCVGRQGDEPVAVGAQHIGQDVGVEAVVFAARGRVPAAQVLDLSRRDHDDVDVGGEQGVDDGPVGPFDRDTGHVVGDDRVDQPADAGRVMDQGAACDDAAGGIDDAQFVGVGRPIHSCRGRGRVMLHVCLLAVCPAGRHPVVLGRARRSLTDRRSAALSPVAAWHVPGRRTSRYSCWPSQGKRRWRWSGRHPGCTNSLTTADHGMVHQ
jgi:hypothetical protein